jgi:tetratricopeptide (TPR) repeat protein
MFVIGRGTSFAYRGKQYDARGVGRELGVRYLLEGGLDGNGERIRATVGLVDTSTGAEVWSERYDRPLDDLFAVRDELTVRIVNSLGRAEGAIRRAQTETARAKPADNLQAFDLMLLGRAAFFRNTREDNAKALELLQRAVQLDPNLARAYMNLAGVYEQQVLNGWAPRDQAMAGWQSAARKAVQLAPENAWSRYVQARWYLLSGEPAAYAAELGRAAELVQDSQLMLLIGGELP